MAEQTKRKDNGGLAFPSHPVSNGMTLRDYFAAKALAGLLAAPQILPCEPGQTVFEAYSKAAYDYADAMLAERAR